jgi:hypothetical protein
VEAFAAMLPVDLHHAAGHVLPVARWNRDLGQAVVVPSFRGRQISDVTAFIVRSTEAADPEAYERFPEQPFDTSFASCPGRDLASDRLADNFSIPK